MYSLNSKLCTSCCIISVTLLCKLYIVFNFWLLFQLYKIFMYVFENVVDHVTISIMAAVVSMGISLGISYINIKIYFFKQIF